MSRKLILYIGMSLDGFIARKDDSVDFLDIVDRPNEDYGYVDFTNSVDTVIWGRKTFDKVLSFGIDIPHKDKKLYVMSHYKKGTHEHAVFHNNLIELVKQLKAETSDKNIYCDGGAEIVTQLLANQLIDSIVISIVPHLVGSGIRLFKDDGIDQKIQFKKSLSFPSGLVQLWYDVINS